MAGLAMRAAAWRWRGLGVGGRLGHLGDGPFRRRFGWLLQQKGIPQVAGMVAAGGMPQAIIANLVEAGWQDVLEKAPDELVAGHGLVAMAIGRPVLVAEGDGLGVDGQDAVVGDADAESVASEIIERGLLSLAPRRDMDDPGCPPDMARQIDIRAEPGEGVLGNGRGPGWRAPAWGTGRSFRRDARWRRRWTGRRR